MKMITFIGAGVACAAMGGVLLAQDVTTDSAGPQAAQVFRASGASAADIQDTVDDYRDALGTLNPNVPGSFPNGRREINWDGVPDALSAPNDLPPDFFNTTSPRGAVFFSPGNAFQVSANAGVGPIEFDNLNPGFSALFTTFSPQRLFTALTSDAGALNARTEILFFEPGSTRQATTSGFGVVFTDVDGKNAKVEFLDISGRVLWSGFAPKATGNETLSFLGVKFQGNPVYLVRITLKVAQDAIVMDDFIYGEPQPVH